MTTLEDLLETRFTHNVLRAGARKSPPQIPALDGMTPLGIKPSCDCGAYGEPVHTGDCAIKVHERSLKENEPQDNTSDETTFTMMDTFDEVMVNHTPDGRVIDVYTDRKSSKRGILSQVDWRDGLNPLYVHAVSPAEVWEDLKEDALA